MLLRGVYFSGVLWPASFNAFSHSGFAWLNISSVLDALERRLSMDCGILEVTIVGWLDSVLTYKWLLPGFE